MTAPALPHAELIDWLIERLANCERIALLKTGVDREGWLEDAQHFRSAVAAVRLLAEFEKQREADSWSTEFDEIRR